MNVEKMTIDEMRDVAFDLVKAATAQFAKENKIEEKKKNVPLEKLPERVQELIKFMNGYSFNGHQKAVVRIMSLLMDCNLKPYLKRQYSGEAGEHDYVKYRQYGCYVPIENPNHHDYALNEPVLSLDGGTHMMRTDGTTGNSMPEAEVYAVRPATDREIKGFLAKLSEDHLAAYFHAHIRQIENALKTPGIISVLQKRSKGKKAKAKPKARAKKA